MNPLLLHTPSSSSSGEFISGVSFLYLAISWSGHIFIRSYRSSAASSSTSRISSLIEPIYARCFAKISLSSFPHSKPGVSISSKKSVILTHCLLLVTPGLSPTCALAVPAIRLMKVDFPTFGTPTIIARSVLLIPFSLYLLTVSAPVRSISATAFFRIEGFVETSSTAVIPCFLKYSIHALFCVLDDRSLLLRTTTRSLFTKSASKSGLRQASGARASTISIIISTSLTLSSSIRLAFAIWPGYQLIVCILFLFVEFI